MSDIRQPVTTGEMPYSDGQTWFRVTGELRPDAALAPVIIVHGGPGVAPGGPPGHRRELPPPRAVRHDPT